MRWRFMGPPRYTGDMDILVKPDKRNAERMLAALVDFGFGDLGRGVISRGFTKADSLKESAFAFSSVPEARAMVSTTNLS